MVVIILIVLIPVLAIVISVAIFAFVHAFIERLSFYKRIKRICKEQNYKEDKYGKDEDADNRCCQ